MPSERFVAALSARMNRRKTLVKIGAGAIGGALTVMGLGKSTGAASPDLVDYWCCHLYHYPDPSCQNSTCTWCWTCSTCNYDCTCPTVQCCEGFTAYGDACTYDYYSNCSYVFQTYDCRKDDNHS